MLIDPSLDNLYWADVQWLGAGRVRFGVYYNGQRVVCHEYYHANTMPYPFSATASLPLSFAQRNVAATGSSSEMRVFCAAVWTETTLDMMTFGNPGLHTAGALVSTPNTYQYMATMSPKKLNANGRDNRSIYFPTELEIASFDSVTGTPVMAEVEIVAEPVLSGLSFQPTDFATVEYDTGGTLQGGGLPIYKMFASGHERADLTKIYNNMYSGAVKNYSENGGYREIQIVSISNSSPPTVIASGNWNVREGSQLTMKGAVGMTEINGIPVYLKITGLTTGELYTDADLTTPLDTTTFGDYTNSSGKLTGEFGQQFYWALKCKTLTPSANPARIIAKVSWKEIPQ